MPHLDYSDTVLIHLAALLIIAVVHMEDVPDVWSLGVRDGPWFQSPKDKPQAQMHPQSAGYPTPAVVGPSAVSAPPPAPRRESQQQQAGAPWHGRSRSHTSRSWRERFSAQSFPGQHPENVPSGGQRDVNTVVDAARAFYPFIGQSDAPQQQTQDVREEGTLEPMPVSYRLERIQQPQPAAASFARPPQRARGNSVHRAHSSQPSGSRPDPARPLTHSNSLPPPPSSQPHRRSRSRSQAQAGPSSSSRDPGPSSRRPQLYPLEIPQSSSDHPAPATRPHQASQPPADSLLFSADPNALPIPSRPPRTAPPQRSPRPLPNSSAFYGTQVQSALDEDSPEGDGRSVRTYASTPKPKPMSAAQAYAAAAQNRFDAEQQQQVPPVSYSGRGFSRG